MNAAAEVFLNPLSHQAHPH
uniref:Uncharacterized protein n=1 Tax=Anguilla anguilla TaxID=7936 RepID=A0A0E9SIN6_ANGAN